MRETTTTDPPAQAPGHRHTLNTPDIGDTTDGLGEARPSALTDRVTLVSNHAQCEESSIPPPLSGTPPPTGWPPPHEFATKDDIADPALWLWLVGIFELHGVPTKDTQDLAQDVLVIMLKHLGGCGIWFRAIRSFAAKTAWRVAGAYWRSHNRLSLSVDACHGKGGVDAREIASEEPDQESRLIEEERGTLVRAAVAMLPTRQRQVAESSLLGMTSKQAAPILGASNGSVRTNKTRAIGRIAMAIRDAYGFNTNELRRAVDDDSARP